MTSPSPNWSNSSLRQRSFRGKNLEGANFQGADIRGCDFSQARLKGADFSQARIGLARESLIWGISLMIGSGAIAFHLLSIAIFSILGLTTKDPNYPLSFILIAFIALGSGLVGIAPRIKWTRFWLFIAAGLEGLLYGFLIGGLSSNYNSMIATLSGGLGLILFWVGERCFFRIGFGVMINTLGVTLANGMFFLAGVHGLNALFVGQWGWALGWGLLSGVYFWITVQIIGYLYQSFKTLGWTSFDGADLTDVRW